MVEDEARSLRVVEGARTGSENLIEKYLQSLSGRPTSTVEAYGRVLRQLAAGI